jgi:diadenosine tetraphosphate (Ap4A) HIT family hydrolase
MTNATMEKFGYPGSLVREYEHWVVLLRPSQVTLGSLVLAAKSDATAFGALPSGAHAELAAVTAHVEQILSSAFHYDRINYLMLMMVDPHVHFHIFPRYEAARTFDSETIEDIGWPGPPDLKSGQQLPATTFDRLRLQLAEN